MVPMSLASSMPVGQLPFWLRENPFIQSRFRRPNLTIRQCLRSWFWCHNQTFNIWTHLFGIIVVAWQYWFRFPAPHLTAMADLIFMRATFAAILLSYLCSVVYHTFNNGSYRRAVLLSRVDYFGIITHLIGCMLALVHFVYYRQPDIRRVYLLLFTGIGVACLWMNHRSMFTTIANRHMSAWKRASIFIAVAAVSFPPQLRIWRHYRWRPTVLCCLCCDLAYLAAALIYALKIPERWFPGRCDLFHSHVIFHMLIVTAGWLSIESFTLISWEEITAIAKQEKINLHFI